MIDPTKTTPEKLAEMNDSLIVDNNHLRDELRKAREFISKAFQAHPNLDIDVERGSHDTRK